MENLQFPVQFVFNITSLANDFTATDANGDVIAYVRQKMFRFKEDIQVFSDKSKSKQNYAIKADRWLDFRAVYGFTNAEGKPIGKVGRKGLRSIWKATYNIIGENDEVQFTITEENAWVKVGDAIIGELPIISIFTGYLFNPAYLVKDNDGTVLARLKKSPSFTGRRFEIQEKSPIDPFDKERIMLGLMMMILLERRRG